MRFWPNAEFWRLWGCAFALFACLILIATHAKADARHHRHGLRPLVAHHHHVGRPASRRLVRTVHRRAPRQVFAPHIERGREVARGAGGVIAEAARWLGHGNPTGTGIRNWCADFAQMVLRRTGHRSVASRLARDAVLAGRPTSSPVPGAIMSLPHHTGFVVRVLGAGRVLLLSGNHGHKVGLGVYSTRGARFALPT